MTSFTYGLIAYNIFIITQNALNNRGLATLVKVNDPTGLVKLSVRVFDMFLIGIRYYPILVAQRSNQFVINLTSAIYMLIDFTENVFQVGKCDSIYATQTDLSHIGKEEFEELARILPYFIAYKVASAVPLFIFSSFILIDLVYKSMINLFDFILKYSTSWTKLLLVEKAKDTFCWLALDVDDDTEIFYSNHDLNYVFDLFNPKKKTENKEEEMDSSFILKEKMPPDGYVQKYSKKTKINNKSIIKKVLNIFYATDPHFR